MPRACLLCRTTTAEPHHLCPPCAKELPILAYSCQQCAQLLPPESYQICGTCLASPPPFDAVHALFHYQPPISRLITGLKFKARFSYANPFTHFMHQAVLHQWYAGKSLPDLLIPVPLHAKRLRERGYNQALEIARPLSRFLKLPLDTSIIRHKHTLPQSSLPAAERRQNVADSFAAKRSYHDLHIAVMDDVMTTGNTVSAMAALLRKNGAHRIDIWCCARR